MLIQILRKFYNNHYKLFNKQKTLRLQFCTVLPLSVFHLVFFLCHMIHNINRFIKKKGFFFMSKQKHQKKWKILSDDIEIM